MIFGSKNKTISAMPRSHAGMRIVAGVMSLALTFLVLFSSFFIAKEADHDCTGEDCPVCVCLQLCEKTLHQIGAGAAVCIAVIIPVLFLFTRIRLFPLVLFQGTLVSEKIRLNN